MHHPVVPTHGVADDGRHMILVSGDVHTDPNRFRTDPVIFDAVVPQDGKEDVREGFAPEQEVQHQAFFVHDLGCFRGRDGRL